MKKNNIYNKGLIIGPAGIGAVHLREFIRNGINQIAFIGKSNSKKRSFHINFDKSKEIKIINLENIRNVKKFKPDITSICSPFKEHLNHIKKCKNFSKFLIVEKPFLWSAKLLKDYRNFDISKNLLIKSKGKIAVNLPMVSLANQLILKKETPQKLKSFKFCYFTKGTQEKKNIAVDLLPHALSFLFTLYNKKNYNVKIINLVEKKNNWSCRIKIDEILCIFKFIQDKSAKESILMFDLNKNKYRRLQKIVRNEREDYLLKNKKIKLFFKNPMVKYLHYLLKNFKKSNKILENNRLVLKITKIKEQLLNFKEIKT